MANQVCAAWKNAAMLGLTGTLVGNSSVQVFGMSNAGTFATLAAMESIDTGDTGVVNWGGLDGCTVTGNIFDADPHAVTPAAGTYNAFFLQSLLGTVPYLLAAFDTVAGVPFTTIGGNEVTIVWNTGSNKIFAL